MLVPVHETRKDISAYCSRVGYILQSSALIQHFSGAPFACCSILVAYCLLIAQRFLHLARCVLLAAFCSLPPARCVLSLPLRIMAIAVSPPVLVHLAPDRPAISELNPAYDPHLTLSTHPKLTPHLCPSLPSHSSPAKISSKLTFMPGNP